MKGTNEWDSQETREQPTFLFKSATPAEYRYVQGALRWSRVYLGPNTINTGWILCYPDGKPITYADANQAGSIRVTANGSYMTLA